MIGKECKDFYGFLDEEIGLELPQMNYLVKKLIGCCIRSTYFLFCMKDEQWVTFSFCIIVLLGYNFKTNFITF